MNDVPTHTEPVDPTAELMSQLGKEVLHEIQPQGLAVFAQILRSIADHIDHAAKTHPEAKA